MDFDGDGTLTLPEFQSNFNEVVKTTAEELLHSN